MNLDLKSAAIGLGLGLVLCGGWYAGSTRPLIQRLVEEKAQATGRANQADQETAKYKGAAEHWFAVANTPPQAAPQDPSVAMLNAVRPGLGTVANQIGKALQQRSSATVTAEQTSTPQQGASPRCSNGAIAVRLPGDEVWRCQDPKTGQVVGVAEIR